jgi:hypothetical protein
MLARGAREKWFIFPILVAEEGMMSTDVPVVVSS